MLIGDECVKDMFVDENLQFWFARVKVPDDFQEVFTSLFLLAPRSTVEPNTLLLRNTTSSLLTKQT